MIQENRYSCILNWQNLKNIILSSRKQIQKKYHDEGLLSIYYLTSFFLVGTLALFFVILFRILKPWIIIRIRKLDHSRIGQFAAEAEVYLCEKDRGINTLNQHYLDIWYYDGFISNIQLQKMWNRVLKIWPTHLSYFIDTMNSWLPDGKLYTIPFSFYIGRDVNNVLQLVAPHLSFTPDEEKVGRSALESMGVPSQSLFICFIGRDPLYLQMVCPDTDYSYHDYRNTDVNNYLLMAEEMTNRGYFTIRMGSAVRDSLPSNNRRIIDYATNGQRNDFMDIYLSAKCHFFVSPGTGLDEVAKIFRRPVLYVNIVPLEGVHTENTDHVFILKLYWLEKDQRFMSFREIIELGAGRFYHTNQYVDIGITLIENSDEEILEATIEMDERLKGTWVTTEEDEDLQRRFWSLFKPSELHGRIYSRIGTSFIRKYQRLLE